MENNVGEPMGTMAENSVGEQHRRTPQATEKIDETKKGGNILIRAVIFDMDGTLIDTEKYYRIFWPKALAAFGYTMSDEQALAMRSLGRPFAPAQLKEWFGESLDYAAVRNCRKELMEECLDREGIACKPGALEILQFLKDNHITAAIATATDFERTNRYLEIVGLREYFDEIISATMVKEGKPSPDIYQYACEQLKLSPEECLAVEDSPNGVMSAFRAGCRVVMVPDQTQPDDRLRECLYGCVESLSEIQKFVTVQHLVHHS